ncbi:hypothetical protein H257_18882 [Aphanomyces astaci]|uniref:Uncharacterized protein n=1 Tax=Aphanomyces astaci TaxID=112090 RepID=W4F9R5_APHAT|nr:hypothetical protein H257_18882 [Aphanomyces astaci]ETV64202.1 hypothetical protein H257_18882 [Aphanomyces astaci]|eukprot:XP_009846315.1 hypothetical protein H257_18882 [Aphanomyces astaci]
MELTSSSSSSDDTDTDDEYMRTYFPTAKAHRGSLPGRKTNVDRHRSIGDKQLWEYYFDDNRSYDDGVFRRRYRMSPELFLRISQDVAHHSEYFRQGRDAAGILGFSTLKKCTVAMRMMAYGAAADSLDENFRMGKSTILKTLQLFCCAVDKLST